MNAVYSLFFFFNISAIGSLGLLLFLTVFLSYRELYGGKNNWELFGYFFFCFVSPYITVGVFWIAIKKFVIDRVLSLSTVDSIPVLACCLGYLVFVGLHSWFLHKRATDDSALMSAHFRVLKRKVFIHSMKADNIKPPYFIQFLNQMSRIYFESITFFLLFYLGVARTVFILSFAFHVEICTFNVYRRSKFYAFVFHFAYCSFRFYIMCIWFFKVSIFYYCIAAILLVFYTLYKFLLRYKRNVVNTYYSTIPPELLEAKLEGTAPMENMNVSMCFMFVVESNPFFDLYIRNNNIKE
jgi:hypothetical protein